MFRGSVICCLGDNLGSQAMGGFKEGGGAMRCCRQCMVIHEDIRKVVSVNPLYYISE